MIMPKSQDAEKRVQNFDEVCLGFDHDEAVEEASRCLQCKEPTCISGCPANVNIPGFLKAIKAKKIDSAMEIIKKTNNLPGVCGRVCPQESQCELKCVLKNADKSISIGKLERYAADNAKELKPLKIKKGNKTVAVIGSGPASLTCAADLALKGYNVEVIEALHMLGGVLRYGIPSFRLPRKILDKEINFIKKLGVNFKLNHVIGKTTNLDKLSEQYDAIFLGTGAGLPKFMNIEGEDLCNVYSANEFLVRVNLMGAHKFPDYKTPVKKGSKVVVVGGGNVAMDSARVARRLGAEVTILYRRSFEEMPARIEEIRHAQEEGIQFLTLTNPVKFLGDEKVEGVQCIQMRLGTEDETGRRTPIPIENTELEVEADQVIIAIGQDANKVVGKDSKMMMGGRGVIVDGGLRTSLPNVFAGGDAISGSSTVIKAIGDGKNAAEKIDEYLNGKVE